MERPLKLDPAVWAVLERIAAEADESVGQIIRSAINRYIRRRAEAKTPIRADERLVAPLRALLAHDFAYSRAGVTCSPGFSPRDIACPNPAAA